MHVVVLGGGVSGLSCARLLLGAGHEVTIVSADPLEATTSHLAAAVWFPTAAGPPAAVARWSAATYAILAAEATAGVPGVVLRESLVLYRHAPGTLPLPDWAAAVGQVRDARRDELPPGYLSGLRFVVPLVEMPSYLPHLRGTVVEAGGRLLERRVADLHELHPGGRAYVHPRSEDCILGGTLEVGRWDTAPDPAETEAIVARCTDIVPELAGVEVIESLVGLRPGRPEVRLELDPSLLPVPVVHNYGHGGSGITVGWGCAHDVLAIVAGVAASFGPTATGCV